MVLSFDPPGGKKVRKERRRTAVVTFADVNGVLQPYATATDCRYLCSFFHALVERKYEKGRRRTAVAPFDDFYGNTTAVRDVCAYGTTVPSIKNIIKENYYDYSSTSF